MLATGHLFAPSIAMATVASEQIRASRAKPLRGAERALETLILFGKKASRCDRQFFPNTLTSSHAKRSTRHATPARRRQLDRAAPVFAI
jgi:hypothetical protein